MSDHVTLLLNPTPAQVDQYAGQGKLKAIIENWDAFQATHHKHGKNNPICFMSVQGYLRGVNLQRFDRIVCSAGMSMPTRRTVHTSREHSSSTAKWHACV